MVKELITSMRDTLKELIRTLGYILTFKTAEFLSTRNRVLIGILAWVGTLIIIHATFLLFKGVL